MKNVRYTLVRGFCSFSLFLVHVSPQAVWVLIFPVSLLSCPGNLVLLKVTYFSERDSDEKLHISESIVLDMMTTDQVMAGDQTEDIAEMHLHRSGSGAYIYIGTNDAIYRLPTTRCEQYIDCCQCMAAMDPYCAWDTEFKTCVAIDNSNRATGTLIQDVIGGSVDQCLDGEESSYLSPSPPAPPTETSQPVVDQSGICAALRHAPVCLGMMYMY